jgi:hypothetical protein
MRCAASDLRQAYGRPAANDRPAEGVQPEAAQELAQSAGKLEGPCPHGDVEDAPGEPPDGEDEAPPSGTRWAVPETAEAIADEVASAVRELGHERAAALLVWIRGDAEKAG